LRERQPAQFIDDMIVQRLGAASWFSFLPSLAGLRVSVPLFSVRDYRLRLPR
jgi:hypothetical protein